MLYAVHISMTLGPFFWGVLELEHLFQNCLVYCYLLPMLMNGWNNLLLNILEEENSSKGTGLLVS